MGAKCGKDCNCEDCKFNERFNEKLEQWRKENEKNNSNSDNSNNTNDK